MSQERKYGSSAVRQAAYRERCKIAQKLALASKGLPLLPVISTMPGWPRWNASLDAARELVERTVEEMQGYFDDRSEEWQEGEKGAQFREYIDSVQSMLDEMLERIA